jgi:TolA-binding protein
MKLASILLCIPLTGCFWFTTKNEGHKLRTDVDDVKGRLDKKEAALDDQIKQLKAVLDDATHLLKRNSADLGADVESLRGDLGKAKELVVGMNTTVNDLKTAFDTYKKQNDARLDGLEQRLGQIESGKPSANSSPDDLWRLGNEAFSAARYNDAVEIFKRLVQTFPTFAKANNAQYFKGQSYTKLQDWDKAIGAYQALVEKYPDSDLADDGLYFAAQAAQALKNCTEGRTYLGLIKTKYPKSNVTKQANDLDAQIKKDLKNKAKCSS